MVDATTVLTDIELGLAAGEQILPLIFGALGAVYPPVAAYANAYLPLLQVAEAGVQVVEKATGISPANATQAVVSHLTPGAPNAAALGPQAAPAS